MVWAQEPSLWTFIRKAVWDPNTGFANFSSAKMDYITSVITGYRVISAYIEKISEKQIWSLL